LQEEDYDVYVDAKIEHNHTNKDLKRAFVGYVVPNMKGLKQFKPVNAKQVHDAEYEAVLFAITDLKNKLKRFTVFCDNRSVVEEALKESKDSLNTNQYLRRIRKELADSNPNISLKWFEKNPAHALLSEYVRKNKDIM
jgi:ribonuclease HI